MRTFRYAILLPCVHLILAAPLCYRQQRKRWQNWQNIPRVQTQADREKASTDPTNGRVADNAWGWDPCYEYRPSAATRLLYTVEFPAALIVGYEDCSPGILEPLLRKSTSVRIKSRLLLVGLFLALGIGVQWWLIGTWLDHLGKTRKSIRGWGIPPVIITLAGW